MHHLIPSDFVAEVCERHFDSEEQLRKFVISILPKLLNVNSNQIKSEVTTTSFKYEESERADIVVYSKFGKEKLKRVLMIFELKLDKSVINFENGSYEPGIRKLNKYCQDLGAPYGVLFSDKICKLYEFNLKNEGKVVQSIPFPNYIESVVTWRIFKEFIFRGQSIWYVYLIVLILFLIFLLTNSVMGNVIKLV